jgi:hypothetical protein
VPLADTGKFGLGDECTIDFEFADGALILRCGSSLDRGMTLLAGDDGQRLDLAPVGLPVDLIFKAGRPHLGRGAAKQILFNDEPLGDVRVQLIRGDRLIVDGDEIDIG